VYMLNIEFHKKNHPLAVAMLQVKRRRNNGFSRHILQQISRYNKNVLRRAGRHFIWIRIKMLQIC